VQTEQQQKQTRNKQEKTYLMALIAG